MMKYLKTSILAISLTSLIGCGGGSGGSSSSTGGNTPAVQNLSKTTLIYSQSLEINKELKISIEDNTDTVTTDYSWEVISSPASSNLQLTASTNSKSVLLTPEVAGKYKIRATPATGEAIDTQFSIEKDLPFNSLKLEGYDATQELSKQIGLVSNQAWVYSESLNHAAIESIVSNYQGFTIINFDKVRGLLVEFDETIPQSQTNINKIKAVTGIDTVDPRVFEGRNYIRLAQKVANDGSAFNDGGDNWHLEHIGIEKAWDISTGNSDFYIGIIDGSTSYHTQHEDLRGRFKESTKATKDTPEVSHGTAVAGAIGALTNNNKGISGINWSNQLIAKGGTYFDLSLLAERGDISLVNMSKSLLPKGIPTRFDPSNTDSVEEINKIALAQTSNFRKLATENPNKLFIFAGGNGIGNGAGNNGFFGVDGRHGNPALHYQEKDGEVVLAKKNNVLLVAAHYIDNRLTYYSNYGESIDIAAPTGFKSTKNDSNPNESFQSLDTYYTSNEYGTITSDLSREDTDNAFSGTSASAPLVTGVASLIMAADKELSASNIKSILINSATASIGERYSNPFDTSVIETLAHPIPILNAASALTMTKEIKDGREIKGEFIFSDPFSPTLGFNILSANGKLELFSYKYRASAKENAGAGNYVEFASGNIASFNPLVIQNIGINKTHYKIEGDSARFRHEASKVSISTEFSYEFIIPKVMAVTTDKETQAKIPNVTLDIKPEDGSFSISSGSTDSNGNVRLYLATGKYTIIAKADGYNDLTKAINVTESDTSIDLNLEMTANTSNPPIGGEVGILEPITPLTTSETGTFPGNADIPSFTTTTETGFEGDIEPGLRLRFGVESMQIVDIQRDSSLSQTCEDGLEKLAILSSSDFSTSTITERLYTDGQFVQTCNSTHASILPATTTSSNLEDFIGDWGLNPITTNCPVIPGIQPPNPAAPTNFSCDTTYLINHLITDSTGKEHKISEKYTTVINN